MQSENQIAGLDISSLATEGKSEEYFPWIKVVKNKLFTSFPETRAGTLFALQKSISEEFEKVLTKQNRPRARTLYRVLSELYLHFCWKINWCTECHIKPTCALILYYMTYTGLILSKGDVSSEWFSQTFTALQFLSGDPFLVCDALLLFQNMKKKYHHAYSEILKSWLFDASLRSPSDSECFVKVLLLFRRLKFLSKEKAIKSQIMLYASKIKCPSDVEVWLSSLKIEGLCNIKNNKLIQNFLKKDLNCDAVKKLHKILFSNKYNGRFMNSITAANINQNATKMKKIKKKFDKKCEKVKAEPNEPAVDLSNEINPKNHFRKAKKLTSVLINDLVENKSTISSELQITKTDVFIKQSDYQCFNSSERKLAENSASLSIRKRKLSEEVDKTCLDDSVSVPQKSKRRKLCKKMNGEYKQSSPTHPTLLDDKISDQSVTDSVNKLRQKKGGNISSVHIVGDKNISKETGKQTSSETSEKCFTSSSEAKDLHSYPVENESLVLCNIHRKKLKSDNLSIFKQPCKSKRVSENCSKNDNSLNLNASLVFRKDRTLDAYKTSKHCENSLDMPNKQKSLTINSSSSSDKIKNDIDFSARDESNLLSNQLQGKKIMHAGNSEYNLTDINNLQILNKKHHVLSSGVCNEDRSLAELPEVLNKSEEECENKLVNYSSCAKNTNLVSPDHLRASDMPNTEVQNLSDVSLPVSSLNSHMSHETSENCLKLYNSENTGDQDTRIINLTSPSLSERFKKVYSSPESLELNIISVPSVPPSMANSLELSRSIYSSDSSLTYTDEDKSYISNGKGIPTKLYEFNSKAITELKPSTKKMKRKKVKSKEIIGTSSSSDDESNFKSKAPKSMNNSGCAVARFSNLLPTESNAESFSKINSVSLSDKKEIIIDSMKHLVNDSEERKQMLQDLTSGSEANLSRNHIVEEEKRTSCMEHNNIPNQSEVNDKSSEMQTGSPKILSSGDDNVCQTMYLPVFAAADSSLPQSDNFSKNPYPVNVCTFETLDMQSTTSKNELQKCLPELNNLPLITQKSTHKQLGDSKQVYEDVSTLKIRGLKSVSDDKFDNSTNVLRTSPPVTVKQIFDDVHNSKEITSDIPHVSLLESVSDDKFDITTNVLRTPPVQVKQIFDDGNNSKKKTSEIYPLQNKQFSQGSENNIEKMTLNSSEMPLNNSLALVPDQGSFPEVQNLKQNIILKEVKIILYDCLASQINSVSQSPKPMTGNLAASDKVKSIENDNSIPLDPIFKSEKIGKVRKRILVFDSDSDASEGSKSLQAKCFLGSKLEQSINSSKVPELSYKVKHKRCLESDSDAPIYENGLYNSTASPQVLLSQKEIKSKDFILESASEDSSSHVELSLKCSSSKLRNRKVNPRDFILESASEDNDCYSECSSEFHSYESECSSGPSKSNFIVNSASEDDFGSNELRYLSRSPSPLLRSFGDDKSKNLEVEIQEKPSNLLFLSRSPSPRLMSSKKVKRKTYILESSSEDDADKSLLSSKSQSAKLKPSCKIKSKTLVLESASEDNAYESVSSLKNLSSDSIPSNKVKPKRYVLKSTSEDSADDSVFFKSQVHNKVKSQTLFTTKDNTNLIYSTACPSHDDCKNSENSLINLTLRNVRKNSDTQEEDENCFVPLKKRVKRKGRRKSKKIVSESESDSFDNPNEYKSKPGDSFNLDSSSAQLKSLREKKYEKCHTDSDNLSLGNQDISSKNITASYNNFKTPLRNSILYTNSTQVNCMTELVGFVAEQKDLNVSEINVNSSTNQTSPVVNEKSDMLRDDNQKWVLRESSFESESSSLEDIPLIEIQKKLKTSVNFLVPPENSGSTINLDKSLLNTSSECIESCGKDSEIPKHSPLSESICSVDKKENIEFSNVSINSSVSPLLSANDQDTEFISDKRRQELSETSFELDLLRDEIKKKSSEFILKCQKVLDLQQNLHTEATKENILGVNLEQSFVNNLDICCSENQNMWPKALPNHNIIPPSREESNSLPKVLNNLTEHQLLGVNKSMCNLVFSEKEHSAKDSSHDSNYLSDESFIQTLLDKVDPSIFNNEDYLNYFVDNYLVSSSTHTALNENIDNSDCLKNKSFNSNSSLFNSVFPYSNTVNKSNQQNSELISNTLNNEVYDFHKTKENVIESKIIEFDALDIRNVQKNVCLNSNLASNQTLEEIDSQPSTQYLNSCSNTELQQLDFGMTPTKRMNVTQNSGTYNLAPVIKSPIHNTYCVGNRQMLEPLFSKMNFEEASPDKLNVSINSETSLKELKKNVMWDSELNFSNQDHLNNYNVDTLLNTREKLQIEQANLNNTTHDANEKILFICDVENKTSQVHIMPQQLLVTFLNKLGNVSENHTLCSNSTKCNCFLCCYTSSAECRNGELSNNNASSEMGHICVNGIKLSTSSLFPVVNLGKRCDETETVQNSSGEKESAVSTPNKVLEQNQCTIKKQCFVKSSSKNIVSKNSHRKVLETKQNSSCKNKSDSADVKIESIPKRSYNLRKKSKRNCLSYDSKQFQTKKK